MLFLLFLFSLCFLLIILRLSPLPLRSESQTSVFCFAIKANKFARSLRWHFTHSQVTKFVTSRFMMIPIARINSMPARAKPLRRTRLLKEGWTSRETSSVSTRSTVSVTLSESSASSDWGPVHANVKGTHLDSFGTRCVTVSLSEPLLRQKGPVNED